MNKERRQKISKIIERLEDIAAELEALADEERDAFDNLPEAIQYSERGEAMEAAADDPTGTVEDGIVLEPEEDEALPKPVAAPETELKAAGQEKSAVEQKYTEYVVRPGDTLSGIAKKFYKDGRLFGRIYEANKDVIPNPNKLPLGAKIRIPQP